MPTDSLDSHIDPAIRALIAAPPRGVPVGMADAEFSRLVECLWQSCRSCARQMQREFPGQEADDLANEYLSLIGSKESPKFRPYRALTCKSHLYSHMKRVLRKRFGLPWCEVRELASEALWSLERKKTAVWLAPASTAGQPARRVNLKFTTWCSAKICGPGFAAPAPADLSSFFEKAKQLPQYYPPGATSWQSRESRVISPKDAETLTEMLLDCADGCICFEDILSEFIKHVQLLSLMESLETETSGSREGSFLDNEAAKQRSQQSKMGVRHGMTELAFWELVAHLAKKAWDELQAAGLTMIVCQYLLANALVGRRKKLDSFGHHSTAFDQKQKALSILRQVFSADDFLGDESEISDWHDKLWAEALRCLAHSAEFCDLEPEKSDFGVVKQ